MDGVAEQLSKLAKMHADGALSDEEFAAFKAQIISSIGNLKEGAHSKQPLTGNNRSENSNSQNTIPDQNKPQGLSPKKTGYFNGLVEMSLKRDKDGCVIFYGARMTNDADIDEAKALLKKVYVIGGVGMLVSGILVGWFFSLLTVLPLALWGFLNIKYFVQARLVPEKRWAVFDTWERGAAAFGKTILWSVFSASILMAGIGAILFVVSAFHQSDEWLMFAFVYLFFGCCAAIAHVLLGLSEPKAA